MDRVERGLDKTEVHADAARGAAIYSSPAVLSLYDLWVLRFSNSFVWRCPSRLILDFYNQHVSEKHLDVGVGTGYFLDRCRFPSATPEIILFDLSPASLHASAKRLRRYSPSCHVGNVLEPVPQDFGGFGSFGSIGLNYLLHCLPGDLTSKALVFANLKPLLRENGVIFGATILGSDVAHNFLGKKLMKTYNRKGIFSNVSDCRRDLEAGLRAHFREFSVRVEGCVALFSAVK